MINGMAVVKEISNIRNNMRHGNMINDMAVVKEISNIRNMMAVVKEISNIRNMINDMSSHGQRDQ